MAGHNNYKLRDGWITKGMRLIKDDPQGFSRKEAGDVLGITNAMADSCKYWLVATGVAQSSRSGMSLTHLGEMIYEHDRYLEEELTWFLMHRCLLRGGKFKAATVYFESGIKEMRRDALKEWMVAQIGNGKNAEAMQREAAMLIGTYAGERTGDPEEDAYSYSSLSELKLMKKTPGGTICKTEPGAGTFPKELVLLEIDEECGKSKGCSIQKVTERMTNTYNTGWCSVNDMLDRMQAMDLIRITRTAGLDQIYKRDEFPKDLLAYMYDGLKKD